MMSTSEQKVVHVGHTRRIVVAAIACSSLAIAVYLPVLNYGFVYDDIHIIVKGTYIRQWSNFFDIYAPGALKEWGQFVDPTRPLNNLSYFIDYSLWGMNPAGYHMTSLLIHAVAVGLAVWASACLMPNLIGPCVVGVLMAIHPIHSETVASVSYREDLLAALFGLLALGLLWSSGNRPVRGFRLSAILTATICSVLSKESGIVIPLVGIGGDYILNRRIASDTAASDSSRQHFRNRRTLYLLLFGGILLFVVFRFLVRGMGQESISPLPKYAIPHIVGKYIALLLWPATLNADWVIKDADLWQVLTGFLLIAILIGAAVAAFRKLPLLTFGVAFFLVALGPVSNIVTLFRPMAERYLYLPSFGFFLAIGSVATWLYPNVKKNKVLVGIVFVSALIVFGTAMSKTLSASARWKDELSLWRAVSEVSPKSSRAWNHLGNAQLHAKDYEAAELSYLKAIAVRPDHFKAMNNLGTLYIETGRMDKAIALFQDLVKKYPSYPVARQNLGSLYMDQGKLDRAIEQYRIAVELHRRYVKARANLIKALVKARRHSEARQEAAILLSIDPTNKTARSVLDSDQ